MPATRRLSTFISAGALISATVLALPTAGIAADIVSAPLLSYESDAAPVAQTAEQPALDPAAVDCMAKVVLHEAGGEPRAGQVAVAQTLMNRLNAGRFGGSICAIVNQPGQFFSTASYNPDKDRDNWAAAVDVAREVLSGEADPVAPGAIFFHAARAANTGFFRSRQRVAMVGAQVFYR